MLTMHTANIIEQALSNDGGSMQYWLSQTTPDLVATLTDHGMRQVGTQPRHGVPDGEPFWGIWEVVDRPKALAAVLPFRTPGDPLAFTLTPIEQDQEWKRYTCPKCASGEVHFHDGDSVGVPVLPHGIKDYNDIDTALMVGSCKACDHPIYFIEFGFTNVTNPDDDDPFCVMNLPQKADAFQVFRAEAEGMAPWLVSRLWYTTGKVHGSDDSDEIRRLPKGPFVVDYHQFGAFSLEHEGELSGKHGVARCSGRNSKWESSEQLFQNLAANAMQTLLDAVAAQAA